MAVALLVPTAAAVALALPASADKFPPPTTPPTTSGPPTTWAPAPPGKGTTTSTSPSPTTSSTTTPSSTTTSSSTTSTTRPATTTTAPATTTTTWGKGAPPPPPPPAIGYDVSFPQCGGALPANPAFGIVGDNGGRPFDHNPCLATQYAWAASAAQPAAFYINTANPGTASPRWTSPGPHPCNGTETDVGCAYNYGWNGAADAFAYAVTQTPTSAAAQHAWWLDVETANSWSPTVSLNGADVQGAIDYLRSQGVAVVGLYSTAFQWGQITGGASMALPNWVAGATDAVSARSRCGTGFSGGPVRLVQFPSASYDGDIAC